MDRLIRSCADRGKQSGEDTVRERIAHWTREQAAAIEREAATIAPVIAPPPRLNPDLHVWDTWLLRNRDGTLAEIDGFRVIFSLTAPADLPPGKRHDVATVRYFYSSDGRTWRTGGPVFERQEALGSRQWAGSALCDDGDLYCFYTAVGDENAPGLTYEQRIVGATGGSIETDDGRPYIEGPWFHEQILSPDGVRYERERQGSGMIYTFRDPWFFEDPGTGETCLLFEANSPVTRGSDDCDGDPARQEFNGCVGLAVSPTGDPTSWELDDPLLDATCVNQEVERPHLVVRDGRYYLFASSHEFTFAPGLDGYEALYGFVADELRGDYRPLNDSGLVLTNPPSEPYQAYSWIAYDHPNGVLVTSFFNYYELGGLTIDDIGDLPVSQQREKFGGTLAPTLRLRIDGGRTRVVGALGPGHIPSRDEPIRESDESGIEHAFESPEGPEPDIRSGRAVEYYGSERASADSDGS
jgi:levansucrase